MSAVLFMDVERFRFALCALKDRSSIAAACAALYSGQSWEYLRCPAAAGFFLKAFKE
jgi:hypothetical protein